MLLGVRPRGRGGPDLGGMPSTGRRSPTSASSPGRTTSTGRAESLFKRAPSRTIRCTPSRRATTSRRSSATRRARRLGGREEAVRRPGGQQPAHGARARQQQPAGVLDAGVHLLRHEHARDGQAGRQPGDQEGRRDRDRQVRGGEGRGGRRGQGGRQGQEGQEGRRKGQGEGATTTRKTAKEVDVREAGTGVTGDDEEATWRSSTTPSAWSS